MTRIHLHGGTNRRQPVLLDEGVVRELLIQAIRKLPRLTGIARTGQRQRCNAAYISAWQQCESRDGFSSGHSVVAELRFAHGAIGVPQRRRLIRISLPSRLHRTPGELSRLAEPPEVRLCV